MAAAQSEGSLHPKLTQEGNYSIINDYMGDIIDSSNERLELKAVIKKLTT